MQYQLYNIVDIKLSRTEKIIKGLISSLGVFVEIIFIISLCLTIKEQGDIRAVLLNVFIFPIFVLLVYIQIGKDRRDRTLLFVKFEDDKVIIYYPNITNKRKRQEKTITLHREQIENIDYKDTIGIMKINYMEGLEKKEEILYLQENNKEEIHKLFLNFIEQKSESNIRFINK